MEGGPAEAGVSELIAEKWIDKVVDVQRIDDGEGDCREVLDEFNICICAAE
jgi:hypothetical protein